jgi:3-hydroxyacyl-CoA dehydrogenase
MPPPVKSVRHDDVVVLEIDNPPVNALSPGVPEVLLAALGDAERDDGVSAVVVRGAGRMFVAGADIAALEEAAWGNEAAAPDWHELLHRLESCPKPVVMAIHGAALGGGLELALAGHYRITTANAQLGQPEVNLGVIPGGEGTQRLPRLAGIAKALDMCVTGRALSGAEALQAGLADEIAGDDLTASAVDLARRVSAGGPLPRTRDRRHRLGDATTNAPLFAAARQLAASSRRREQAPPRAIDAIEAASTLAFPDGCRRERELFLECLRDEQAKALIHVFLAERAAVKPPAADGHGQTAPIRRVVVVGAGALATAVATACADAGIAVVVAETPRPPLTADLVVEAVADELALKQQVLREADRLAAPGCVLATSTATLDVDAIAAVTSRPDAVVGLPFFADRAARLLAIARGRSTSDDVVLRALAFARRLKMPAVVVANGPGFVGNRLVCRSLDELKFVAGEGATPEQVERAIAAFGIDQRLFVCDDDAGEDVAAVVHPASVSDEAIVERAVDAIVNDAARALEAGIVRRASDIDVIFVRAYGFPAWRGGPMFHADRVGLARVAARVEGHHRAHGDRWRPAGLLLELAAAGRTFRNWDRARPG